jgi:3-deoxy-manno-octulosonate cytidylyltransferase (CMP-KDO synthetase)
MNKYIVIPARLESQRLPNKLLLKKGSLTVLDYAIRNALEILPKDSVILATDSLELETIARVWGIRVIRTRKDHKNGTSRICEAVQQLNPYFDDIIVNLQADCVKIDYSALEYCLAERPYIRTCYYHASVKETTGPSFVKVIKDHNSNALYFSRSQIPYNAERNRIHIGVYGFNFSHLVKINLTRVPLAHPTDTENLEQLQWLVNNIPIKVSLSQPAVHIDTKEDYDKWLMTP